MKPENYTERKKTIRRFATLYIATLAVLVFVFAVLGHSSGEPGEGNPVDPLRSAETARAGNLLLRQLKELEKMDEHYAFLLSDSVSRAEVRAADSSMVLAEKAFEHSIDSIQREGCDYSMIAAYRTLLLDRRTQSNIRAALTSSPGINHQDGGRLKKGLTSREQRPDRMGNRAVVLHD